MKSDNLSKDINAPWIQGIIRAALFRYTLWQLPEGDREVVERTLSLQTSRLLPEKETFPSMPDYKSWTLAACYLWLLTSILVAEGISAQFFAWGLISGRVSLDVFYLVGFVLVWAGLQNIPRYVRRAVFTLG